MVRRLAQGTRRLRDPSSTEGAQCLRPGRIPRVQLPRVALLPRQADALAPAGPTDATPEHVGGVGIHRAQRGGEDHPALEAQAPEVLVHGLQVGVVQFPVQLAIEALEPVRREGGCLLAGDLPHAAERYDKAAKQLRGPMEQRRREARRVDPVLALLLDGGHRDGVQLTHDVRMGEAVGQDPLPVPDLAGVVQAAQERSVRSVAQVLVAGGHGVEQDAQAQVGEQVLRIRRQGRLEVQVAIRKRQADLHRASRAFTLG